MSFTEIDALNEEAMIDNAYKRGVKDTLQKVREAWEEFKYSHLVTTQNGYVCLRPEHWLKAIEEFEKKLGIDADASNIRVADATLNLKGE